jgi:2-polyprenyl-6-methoxyphenol hydroxylase-like FAD-dependent oxidoreductase
MLSPNALRVLDSLGVYERVRTLGYNFENLEYKDQIGNLIEIQEFGNQEKYGYKSLRIYRHVLIDELLAILKEKSIPIIYGKKFSRVIEETDEGVTWELTDNTTHSAVLLVGADGIHSTVRQYVYPDLVPEFTGMAGITAAVPTSQLKLPSGYHIPVTILAPTGGFVIAPQQIDGSEVLIGKQLRLQDRDRSGWEKYAADKDALVKFLQDNDDNFPEFVHNAASQIPHNKINVWPFYVIPKLEKWTSPKRHVVILGDAAHAIPPSAGQGINQAFEDVYIFALLLARTKITKITDALKFWQSYRQARIEKVMELNHQIDLRRVPKNDSEGRPREGLKPLDLRWLFEPNFEDDVNDWISENEASI